jgi:hypothetical protein
MAFPTNPSNGDTAIVGDIKYVYNSSYGSWTRVVWTPHSSYIASSTAPTNPTIGDQWYKTDVDILYEYISDGLANYWIDTSSQTISANAVSIDNSSFNAFLLSGM